jgi:hypothetical protein
MIARVFSSALPLLFEETREVAEAARGGSHQVPFLEG